MTTSDSSPPKYWNFGEPKGDCAQCIAWYGEVQRVSLLLERLAEDHFPDQASFDAWTQNQLKSRIPPEEQL